MEPNKSDIKRDVGGKIVAGSGPLNPAGRPKGKTLKEFAREYLMNLPDEEKMAYLKTLPQEIVWKMAEGNPHSTQETVADITSGGLRLGAEMLDPRIKALSEEYEKKLRTTLIEEKI